MRGFWNKQDRWRLDGQGTWCTRSWYVRARCSVKGCCRGFTGQTLHRAVKLLVSTGVPQEKAIKCITEAARETKKALDKRGLVCRKEPPSGHWPNQPRTSGLRKMQDCQKTQKSLWYIWCTGNCKTFEPTWNQKLTCGQNSWPPINGLSFYNTVFTAVLYNTVCSSSPCLTSSIIM